MFWKWTDGAASIRRVFHVLHYCIVCFFVWEPWWWVKGHEPDPYFDYGTQFSAPIKLCGPSPDMVSINDFFPLKCSVESVSLFLFLSQVRRSPYPAPSPSDIHGHISPSYPEGFESIWPILSGDWFILSKLTWNPWCWRIGGSQPNSPGCKVAPNPCLWVIVSSASTRNTMINIWI